MCSPQNEFAIGNAMILLRFGNAKSKEFVDSGVEERPMVSDTTVGNLVMLAGPAGNCFWLRGPRTN